MSNNIIDFSAARADRDHVKAVEEMANAWGKFSDSLAGLPEPTCFLAAGFSPTTAEQLTALHQQVIIPHSEFALDDDRFMCFSIKSGIRSFLSRGGYAEYDDVTPETFAVFELFKSEVPESSLPASWNYRAIEIFFAHMTQIAEDFKSDAMCFLEIVNEFDKNGWTMVEHNLKNQNGNGLIVKVAKPGYGHVVITLHYRRLVDDWKEFERATAHVPEEEDE